MFVHIYYTVYPPASPSTSGTLYATLYTLAEEKRECTKSYANDIKNGGEPVIYNT
jgi:hypothetical protein